MPASMHLENIVSELKAHPHSTFKVIFNTYYADLYKFAYAYVMKKEEAEDIVQECFTSLWQTRNNLHEQTNLKSYLFSIIKNACLNYLKHLQVTDSNADKLVESLIFSNTVHYEESEYILNKVYDIIAELPTQQQMVLKYKLVDNMSYQEIALAMNISTTTVHTYIKRAYKTIREKLPIWVFIYLSFVYTFSKLFK